MLTLEETLEQQKDLDKLCCDRPLQTKARSHLLIPKLDRTSLFLKHRSHLPILKLDRTSGTNFR